MNYDAIKTAALRACPGLLFAWLPGGRLHGTEYDVLNPTRDDRTTGNFRINVMTGKWADFATGEGGGDLISLRAYLDGVSQSDAAADIERQLGLAGQDIDPAIAPFLATLAGGRTPPVVETDICCMPVPDTAPPAPLPHGRAIWTYTNACGELLGYVVRQDRPDGKKDFRPLTYWKVGGWQKKSWPRPAPLYRQNRLAEYLYAPVLVVEGEKTCDAAESRFLDFVSVTWPGGSARAGHADWSVLAGRRVWLLPDADEPGKKAMSAVAEALRGIVAELHLAILPLNLPEGWDVADLEEDADAEAWRAGLQWVTLKGPVAVAPPSEDRFSQELARANGRGPQYAVHAPASTAFAPLPVPALARLEQEILTRVPMRCPLAAQITVKALMAFITGRQTVSQAGDPTGLYLAMAAPSVGDLRPYLAVARDVVEQIGMNKAVRQQRLANPGQIHKLLWRNPNLLHLCTEWGILLQFAKRQPAGTTEQVLTLLSEVWSGKPITIDADDIKLPDPSVDGQYVIRAPHLTMLAALSHDQLATAMKLSEMGRGALEQIQYWILEDDEFTEADPDTLIDAPFPEDLIDELRTLATPIKGDGNLAGLMGPDQAPAQVVASFAESVAPLYAPLETLPTHRSARSILSAARQIARREATNYAFCLNRAQPVLSATLVRRAVADEVTRLGRLLVRFTLLSSEDGKLSAYQKVLDFITAEKGKGAGQRALYQYCWAYRNLEDCKREALLKQLLSDEAIVEIQPESKPGARRKALVYVARQFAKAVK